jgi:anthranilate/para-aminobenzoate synthase component I
MNREAIGNYIKRGALDGRVVAFGSARGPKIVISNHFESISFEELKESPFCVPRSNPIVGFLSYDHLRDRNYSDSFFYRILKGYEIDFSLGTCRSIGAPSDGLNDLGQQFSQPDDCEKIEKAHSGFALEPLGSDEQYLSNCKKAIEWIRDGRFYQLNLLRYFRLKSANRHSLVSFWLDHAATYGSLLIDQEREIYSFSPERFIEIKSKTGINLLSTFPVKGTRRRGHTLPEDVDLRNQLFTSEKDRAELAMIVDLMRSDLSHVCRRSSISVIDPGSILSFPSIHHLAAEIQGELLEEVTFEMLLHKIFPAGSITGAPKIEVMKAILELEERQRGFFMGSAFYLDGLGQLSSTVMIRTALKLDAEYQYAAGSGIVIKSDPVDEMMEINVKCQVLTGGVNESIVFN